MLKVLRIIFAIVAMVFAVYGLITRDFELQPYMIFFLGLMILVMGLEEFKKEKRSSGWLCIVVSLLLFFVFIKGLLLV